MSSLRPTSPTMPQAPVRSAMRATAAPWRATKATRACSAVSRRTSASPSPEVPPVMATRRPVKLSGCIGCSSRQGAPQIEVQVNLKSRGRVHILGTMDLLTIGEIARRAGVAASALRFYEEKGLIRSERAGSGHRRYPRSVLRRIAFIVFAQRVGLSLEEIAAALAKLPDERIPKRADWARLSGAWTRRIDQRIAE